MFIRTESSYYFATVRDPGRPLGSRPEPWVRDAPLLRKAGCNAKPLGRVERVISLARGPVAFLLSLPALHQALVRIMLRGCWGIPDRPLVAPRPAFPMHHDASLFGHTRCCDRDHGPDVLDGHVTGTIAVKLCRKPNASFREFPFSAVDG